MKAWAFRRYNGAAELLEIPQPVIGENEVLIEVKSVGLNKVDDMLRKGEFKSLLKLKMPRVMGSEAAGVVRGLGAKVTGFKVGDEVMTKPDILSDGTLTQFIKVKASEVAHKPKNLTWSDAASLPLVALTAWQALVVHGKVKAGQSVLIHGGSGGVGSIAVQLAKHLGAKVSVTASAANAEYVKSLGADLVIDYRSEDFTKLVAGYDFVLDSQGGENLFKSISVLKNGGLAVGIVGPPDTSLAKAIGASPVVSLILGLISAKVRKAAKAKGASYKFLFVEASGEQLTQIAQLVETGVIKHQTAQTFSFKNSMLGIETMLKGSTKPRKYAVDFSKED